jgi:hypothetical protein
MRNEIISILSCLLLTSCNGKKHTPIIEYPLQIKMNEDVEQLKNWLKKNNIILAYENSYEGEIKGIKLFYFDDYSDSLLFHFKVYTLNSKIKGIEGHIFSGNLPKDIFFSKVEKFFLPDFKKHTMGLENVIIEQEKDTTSREGAYYNFEVIAQELKEK